jgi:SAM-dependent methyltransferase
LAEIMNLPGIQLRHAVESWQGVGVFLDESHLPACDRKELAFWQADPRYNRSSPFWENLKVKAGELRMFEDLLPRIGARPGERILELGAGQGWASAMLKHDHPGCEVHASDVSPEALLGAQKWEQLLGARLDGLWACQADHTPFADAQFDCIFTFAAFHHFAIGNRDRAALAECFRLLRPHGRLVLLAEPTAPAWLHGWAKRKLDAIRSRSGFDIEEDVLVPGRLARAASGLGARMRVDFDTSWSWREIRLPGVIRSAIVRRVPALGWIVPIGAHITFTRG